MAALNSLYPLVRPWLPGVPEVALDLTARQVVRDFCRKTRALVTTLEVALPAGTSSAALAAPTGFELVSVVTLRYDGRHLNPKTADALDTLTPFQDWRTLPSGEPAVYVADDLDPRSITVYPGNGKDAALQVRVAVTPTGSFTEVPDVLLRWERALASGMKAALYGMKDTPYFSTDLMQVEEARYADGWASARFDVTRGAIDAPAHVAMTPFA